ncbi:unnamed protein product [Pedinophyceae sp. YPF-701]|nr:unnamed protein product [Pedinophyceae sp. YPF-701]
MASRCAAPRVVPTSLDPLDCSGQWPARFTIAGRQTQRFSECDGQALSHCAHVAVCAMKPAGSAVSGSRTRVCAQHARAAFDGAARRAPLVAVPRGARPTGRRRDHGAAAAVPAHHAAQNIASIAAGAAAAEPSSSVATFVAVAAAVGGALLLGKLAKPALRSTLWPGAKPVSRCPFGFDEAPEDLGAPFLGHMASFMADPVLMAKGLIDKYGRHFRGYIMGFGHYMQISDPDEMKKVLSTEWSESGKIMAGAAAWPDSVNDILGHDSLNADEENHTERRAILAPAFEPAAVAGYLPAIQALAERTLASWSSRGGEPLEVYDGAKLFAFEIIVKVVLGMDLTDDELAEFNAEYKTLVGGLFLPVTPGIPGSPYVKAMEARKQVIKRIGPHIDKVAADLASGAVEKPTVIHNLVAESQRTGNGIPRQALIDIMIVLLFAGHDTSTSAITMITQQLALHPEWVPRLVAEQRRVVEKRGAQITSACLSDMAELDAVVRETLRVKSPVAGAFRVAGEDIDMGGWSINKGEKLLVTMTASNYFDKKQFMPGDDTGTKHMEYVEGWDPERWLDRSRRPNYIIQFGLGPRRCLGMNLAMAEMKVLFAVMMRGYDFECKDASVKWKGGPIGIPAHGLPTVFSARSNQEGLVGHGVQEPAAV